MPPQFRSGISVLDINEKPIGTVLRVLSGTFIADIEGEHLELDRSGIFSADEFSLKLVCEREAIGRYCA